MSLLPLLENSGQELIKFNTVMLGHTNTEPFHNYTYREVSHLWLCRLQMGLQVKGHHKISSMSLLVSPNLAAVSSCVLICRQVMATVIPRVTHRW